jgi:hypothetical protein
MKGSTIFAVAVVAAAWASASFAGTTVPQVPAPSPLLGAGLPGLAVMAAAGAGYVALRLRRRR